MSSAKQTLLAKRRAAADLTKGFRGIFVFLFAFQEYLTATILTDVAARTVPVFIATQLGQTLPMLQQAGAAAMLLTLPVVAFAFIAQRYLVAGLSAGSVKG